MNHLHKTILSLFLFFSLFIHLPSHVLAAQPSEIEEEQGNPSDSSSSAQTLPAQQNKLKSDGKPKWSSVGLRIGYEKASLSMHSSSANSVGISSRGTTPFMFISFRLGVAFLRYLFVDFGYIRMNSSFEDKFPYEMFVQKYVNDFPSGDPYSKTSVINVSQKYAEFGVKLPFSRYLTFEISTGSMDLSGLRGIGGCSDCPSEGLDIYGGKYYRYRYFPLNVYNYGTDVGVYISYLKYTSALSTAKNEIGIGFRLSMM